ncbi:MAG: hypothetical protein JWO95_384 [Verrucomicrobiales bacterium]|nr:hypothetical protein [Verrucomicrobiales bacterium]
MDLLVRALAISLVLHVFAFGTWKYGNTHGWWHESHLPNWLQTARTNLIKKIAKAIPPRTQPQQTTLTFVDVDPTQAVVEPPKNAKFTSSANTVASSTKQAESELPELTGKQQKVLKTTDNSQTKLKAQPLQPTPKPLPEAEKPSPAPKAYIPGDLAIAKPSKKASDAKSEEPEAQEHRRPKSVAEAKALAGITGDKMKHEGGGPRVGLASSLDVRRTITGDYDRIFVDAVQARWDFLLQGHRPFPTGEVRVEFKIHYDGRITDMKLTANTVDAFFSLLCQKAILDNAPYARWSQEMRRELAGDTRDVTFAFFYE